MNLLFPFLAAVLQAGSFTLDKTILSIKRIGFKEYAGVSFPLIFVFTLIIFLIFRPPFSRDLFSNSIILLLAVSIAISIGNNLFFYRALDSDKLSELQVFELLTSIPVIIFTSLIFSDERKFFVIVPALIASTAVVWSHWEHHHFQIAQKTAPYLVWILVASSVSAPITKKLLTIWNPISLELVRNGALALIIGSLFEKRIKKISPKGWGLLLLTNLLSAVAYILLYFSYQMSGVVYSILIFSILPLLVYFASIFLLKEPFHRKKGIAFIIVLISVAIAQILG